MSVMPVVHQLPMGHPHVPPMAHPESVEQPWLMYELTAVWRVAPSGKHGLDCALAGAMDVMMMTRTADWNLGIMIDDDDDVGLNLSWKEPADC